MFPGKAYDAIDLPLKYMKDFCDQITPFLGKS